MGGMDPITPEVISAHGLSRDEYARLLKVLGREPNITELGIFSVMWSEHCSYKSSKKWLKTLPTEAPWVICGPGENAGVIDIGDGQAVIFKMESHNHPSYIEPYQGAATGVGGILRDVFTMGARPIANLNALRFGGIDHAKTKHLVSGVVAGIGGYGNCVGVPTVGGECEFHPAYNGNILVNAMTVGLVNKDKIFYSAATGIGNPVIYVGSKTGRDGIHGATMASTEFNDDSEEKRPTVQVGDPFTEKLLIEACLELMATDVIVAIQDMGAAGLTSSSFEMASKGGVGIEMNLDKVPVREEGITPYEMMLSESQERMLIVLKPGAAAEEKARAIFDKWELDFAVVGHITDSGRMVLTFKAETIVDLPIDLLVSSSPEYDRPWTPPPKPEEITAADVAADLTSPGEPLATLKKLVACPDLASKRWIWEQYDHMVMADTVSGPGGDAAIVRVHGTGKALALTIDCTPRYCLADPVQGGRQAVAEAWRNITATGAKPLAITDNLNFGNPEKPDIMGQFVGCIKGIGEACAALDFPVVSGNVSLYNETKGKAVLPTPTIGGVGLLADAGVCVPAAFQNSAEAIILIGESLGNLGATLYLREIEGREEGAPPHVDLKVERRNGDFVRGCIEAGHITACHDLSGGGLGIGLAEMAMAGNMGATIEAPDGVAVPEIHGWLYAEDQGRYLMTTKEPAIILAAAKKAAVAASEIGVTGGGEIALAGNGRVAVAELLELSERWMADYMTKP